MAEKNLHVIFNKLVTEDEREDFADLIEKLAAERGYSILVVPGLEEETFTSEESEDNA
jgi:hypothetical protein